MLYPVTCVDELTTPAGNALTICVDEVTHPGYCAELLTVPAGVIAVALCA